ncbi:Phosphate regulon sensor protein PhoR [Sulfitobacter sp. THAF37]|uniref:sensor histidine kinase n=1 Tax=Sulfitobacter sp. THAF37 TaxID=2587855 RepID=UPI001267D962|nr:HAMP domain-containing sensor histidine kinase [Sulfitobacter sp. THAF37]QFT59370.1 Phosphate regulon sensor protein PhoR [Sulfitobacter sp. THAF37]
MDRGDILSGAAFSAVFRSALAFIVMLVLFGWVALNYIERSLITELGDDVQQRWNIIAAEHAGEGEDHMVQAISDLAQGGTGGHHAAALFGEADALVAGNIRTRPKGLGLQVGPLDHAAASPDDVTVDYIHFTGPVDDRTLVVGLRLDLLYRTKVLVFRALTLSGFLVVVTMLAVGYYLSRQSLRRLQDIETALSKTSEGDTAIRIAEKGGRTQIDRIARQMNLHLDRLSRMIETTRNTAAAAAHDLKSPLGRAYLSLGKAIEQVDRGEDPDAALTDTQDELEKMRVIFDSYLQLSRIEAAGRAQFSARVDLRDLTTDLVETFAMIADDAGQSLSFDVQRDQDYGISGDGQMLQQMVVNLLQNAVTHGAEGNRISVRLDRSQAEIRLAVTDTGPGIPADARQRVFEPFYRLDPSRSKPGSGLGLALVQAIAERHRGRVALGDNEPGLIVEVVLPGIAG